ncbi:MAG: FHA domain-containing protein [Planctomycetota bacterium]
MSRQLPLSGERTTIGSAEGNSLVLRQQGIAPQHCVLERISGGFKLVDLNTENGTLVNGSYIGQKRLEPGDRIELGDCVILLQSLKKPGQAADSPQGSTPASPKQAPPASPKEPAPAAGQEESAAAGTEPRGNGQRRRDDGRESLRIVRTALYTVTALLLVAGIGSILPGLFSGADAGSYGHDRLSLAGVFEQAGDFNRAVRVLEDLALEADSGVSRETVTLERDRIQKLALRQRMGREDLAALLAEPDLSAGEQLERTRRLQETFAGLPLLQEEIEDHIRRLEGEVQLEVRKTQTPVADLARMSEALLKQGNFAGARNVWNSLAGSDLVTDAELLGAVRDVIDQLADVAAELLLAEAGELENSKDYLGALLVLDETELNAFRGTRAFSLLDARAKELEEVVSAARPGRGLDGTMPLEDPREFGSRRAGGGKEPAPEDPAREWEKPAPPVADRTATRGVDQAIDAGDGLFFAGSLSQAIAAYDAGLGPRLSFGERTRLTRRLERAQRARWFLDALRNYVEADPGKAASVLVSDSGGEQSGTVRGVKDGKFKIEGGGRTLLLDPEQLASASIQALARNYRLTLEDQLNMVFFRMTGGIEPGGRVPAEYSHQIARLMEMPDSREAVYSAIAFLRGLPEVPEWGFFRHEDQWLSFREREQAQNRAAIEAAVVKLDKNGGKTYAEGLEELKALMPVARQEVVEVLYERRKALRSQLLRQPELASVDKLRGQKEELDRRREHALELIFDTEKYFYPYSPPACPPDKAALYWKVQQEVDLRVAAVRELWGNEFQDDESGVAVSKKLNWLLQQLREEQTLLMLGDQEGFQEEEELAQLKLLPANARRINIRNLALDPEERARLNRNVRVLEKNATGQWAAERQELEQVLITNQYRLMMGRPAVLMHDALIRSSRAHCKWMSMTGKFSHFNDEDPKLRTPQDRIKAQGYETGGSGENIAMCGGAMVAHTAWIHSSGHHRNILFPSHRELGSGNMGSYWCQNFAGGAEYRGNLIDEDL